jgi:bifunctional non-homologous end joining protein LigD
MGSPQSALDEYRKKRDFGATPEPAGRVRRAGKALQFVVQRHAARQLHYDFRLELDGVLKSWAIPKGPSEQVGERRLAVHVEDHPLDYADFEGDIPPGQYGAGHVDIWDRGAWTPVGDPQAGLQDGHLNFRIAGKRLHGRYALIRMKPRDGGAKENWLLIRERDKEETAGPPTKRRTTAAKTTHSEVAGVAISHPDRVVEDTGGITKLDVVQYHADIAKWLLPHVDSRPIAVVKCPGGDLAHCFFQKHPADPARGRGTLADSPPYMHLPKLEDVVAAVQNGVFEFHTWGASFPRIDRPDRITLDLDPDGALSWPTVREACELTRTLLDRLDLAWFLKTTGGKGFHFVVPLVRRYAWDDVKDFARAIAFHLAQKSPNLFTAVASKGKRAQRVFVDYLRNAEGATAVAAYSLRARSGLPVSMPVVWTALDEDVRGAHFNVRNVPALLATRKRDPWADYEASRQRIPMSARQTLG